MKELEWKEVLGRRVLAVPSDGFCIRYNLYCPFRGTDCTVPTSGDKVVACSAFATTDHMFITEDQLPAYLAARLTNQS